MSLHIPFSELSSTDFPLSSLLFRSDLSPSDVAIIREVYDNDNSEDIFQMELEKALQVFLKLYPFRKKLFQCNLIIQIGCRTIVIEPTTLGSETASWINLGSYIKKTSLATGLISFTIGEKRTQCNLV